MDKCRLVSVVIPVYNAETTLSKCVESILAQTYSEIELILVDDGSKDSSSLMCDVYDSENDNIRAIHKLNGGVSSARNIGIEASIGKWVTFCDSDDWFEADAVQNLVNAAEEFNADWVSPRCVGHYYDAKGNFVNDEYDMDDCIIQMKKNNIATSFHEFYDASLLFSTGCRLYSLELVIYNNIRFDEKSVILEDFNFNLRYLKEAKIAVHINNLCYDYIVIDRTSYAKKRSDSRKLLSSIGNIQSVFFDFMDAYSIDIKSKYYDFITFYWIMLIKNIHDDIALTKKQKNWMLKRVISNTQKICLSRHCNRNAIDRKYYVLFTQESIFAYNTVSFLQSIKRNLKSLKR